ncbi:hypothetical protein COO60DRAFT_916765 [Scenedesmus sp. NREL 46B-D3]|nr:hypothetical protein COO60DRAFT_916765 [Scenedesmus sp. NREL 46B-D3]
MYCQYLWIRMHRPHHVSWRRYLKRTVQSKSAMPPGCLTGPGRQHWPDHAWWYRLGRVAAVSCSQRICCCNLRAALCVCMAAPCTWHLVQGSQEVRITSGDACMQSSRSEESAVLAELASVLRLGTAVSLKKTDMSILRVEPASRTDASF